MTAPLIPPAQPEPDSHPQLWPAGFRRGSSCGVLKVDGVRVTDIAAQYGTPAFVVDEADFRARARSFREAFEAAFAEVGAEVDVYYASKAFLSIAIARWVTEEGLRLDVATGGELAVALRAGVPGENLGFHGNNKSVSELSRAIDAGAGRIVVDSLQEVERVAAIARERGTVVPVMVRVTAGISASTHEFIATAHEDQKFGLSIASGAAHEAIEAIIARPELELLGLHSHIGSQIFDLAGFELAARRVLALHAEVINRWSVTMPELDLGGGFGVSYVPGDDPLPVNELATGLAEVVGKECAELGVEVPRIAVEPGRAIAGPSTFTLYEVGTVKPVETDEGFIRTYVSVDGGMSDNIRPALYGANYSVSLASRRSDAELISVRVVGKHCETGDVIVHDAHLPGDIAPGDLLAVPVTGAYGRAMASNYNYLPRPPVLAVRDGQVRVLIRRETEDDLLALDEG
ncbi:MAG TPA: diaminopimelate decarboxylase [Actinomycetales bacterium]|nr:diaminopimelate decarboxylase [Actinomycetales bacterium]